MAKLAIKGGIPVRDVEQAPWPKWPPYSETERRQLIEVLESHNWGGFPAPNLKTSQFAKQFGEYHGAKHTIPCTNGTITLEVALKAAGVKAGDEVIVPTLTWLATAGCAVYVNAVPVFADVKESDLTLNPASIEPLITRNTKAVISVHLGSSVADNDEIMRICKKHNLVYIEDCAHAHGAKWKGRGVGSWGDFGSFSFQSSKLMTAGEGGAITTNNDLYMQKCWSLVNCGRKEWGYDGYEGNVFGYNYRMTEFQAGVLIGQMEMLDEYTKLRAENANYLTSQLDQIEGVETIKPHPSVTQTAHYQYIFKFKPEFWNGLTRDKFIEAMYAEGVDMDGAFYEPIQNRAIFRPRLEEWPELKYRYPRGIHPGVAETPVAAEMAAHQTCWLHYPYLMGTKRDIDDIVAAILKVKDNFDELL